MTYVEVLVASQRYHKFEPLTYSSPEKLNKGTLVAVKLQNQTVSGVVVASVSKPSFDVKPIVRKISDNLLPPQILELTSWLAKYYPSPGGLITQTVLPASITNEGRKIDKDTDLSRKPVVLPSLTSEQAEAIKLIKDNRPKSILLHGDTATGKTRVYIELALKEIERGKSVIILTPEIGLTPQLVQTLTDTFGQQITVLHSHLTPAQKRNAWLGILEHEGPQLIVGPRSALFAPVSDVGLIVIDEAHDTAYKQEQAPYYQTSRVAAKLADLHKAQLIMGSATPLVIDYYAFKEKGLPVVRMTQPAIDTKHELNISIVQLHDRDNFIRSSHLSDQLINAVLTTIESKEQALLFLNRRGTARLVMCENCGWQAYCPRCDIPLTYHGDEHTMLCHTCGFHKAAPSSCPDCGFADLHYKSVGTKTIVDELKKLLPSASIRRFDSDLDKADRLEAVYKELHSGKVDIIVGTQMISKGLDLPKLSLLGILNADMSHYIPDYTADEQSYQLLTQLMGRVARGHRAGKIIVQTHYPEDPTLLSSLERDYASFYERQLLERNTFRFPPFCYLLKIKCSRASQKSAQEACLKIMSSIRSLKLPVEVTGPSPAFHEKAYGKYHWQIIIKSKQRQHLLTIVSKLPTNTIYDLDPINLL